jgi:hypothetical protein
MTTISTTLALGFLPLNMFIYTRFWIDDSTEMPYVQMVVTLLYLWASVFLGYLVGRRWPKTVPYFTKVCFFVLWVDNSTIIVNIQDMLQDLHVTE